jgi:hypothetical protein
MVGSSSTTRIFFAHFYPIFILEINGLIITDDTAWHRRNPEHRTLEGSSGGFFASTPPAALPLTKKASFFAEFTEIYI